MDPLSAVASVITVVAVPFQLAEKTRKLHDFWDSIQGAPKEVHDIKADLDILRGLLKQIGRESQQQSPCPSMAAALRMCSEKVETITSLTADVASGFSSMRASTRKWTALKAVFRRAKIDGVQRSLESMKTTLMLAQVDQLVRSTRLMSGKHDQELEALMHRMNNLCLNWPAPQAVPTSMLSSHASSHVFSRDGNLQANSTPNDMHMRHSTFRRATQDINFHSVDDTLRTEVCHLTSSADSPSIPLRQARPSLRARGNTRRDKTIMESALGTVIRTRKTKLLYFGSSDISLDTDSLDVAEYDDEFRFIPSKWLTALYLHYGFTWRVTRASLSGPRFSLDVARAVPDNAAIFDMCSAGDLVGVRSLLGEGQASVTDHDSIGRTPLWFAAHTRQVELCKFLISCGAERDSRADRAVFTVDKSPLFAIAGIPIDTSTTAWDPDRVIDTLRLFIDLIDVSGTEDDDWNSACDVVGILSECYRFNPKIGASHDVTLWVLEKLGPDVWTEDILHTVMLWSLDRHRSCLDRARRLNQLRKHVCDARKSPRGYSVLHILVQGRLDAIPTWAMEGNFHLSGFSPKYSGSDRWETPTSIAMYRPGTFMKLQRALQDSGTDLDIFVRQAFEAEPLHSQQWNQRNMLELFSTSLRRFGFTHIGGSVCHSCLHLNDVMVLPVWMRVLNAVKVKPELQSIEEVVSTEMSTAELDWQNGSPDIQSYVPETSHICVRCWHKWERDGIRPSVDQSKCLSCGERMSTKKRRSGDNKYWCAQCVHHHPDFGTASTRRGYMQMPQNNGGEDSGHDNDDEEDAFSPFYIHS